MSKNTGSTKFRKVDVDQYDEDQYQEDQVEDSGAQGPSESEISTLLAQNKNVDALRIVLSNPPLAAKNSALKEKAVQTFLRVLSAIKTTEIDAAVGSLDQRLLDILMKFIYKGFEYPNEAVTSNLLTWHEKAFAIGSYGCIVRVLTDRKRL